MKILLPVTDKTIKLWKVSERDKRPEGYNLKDEEGRLKDISTITSLQVHAQAQTDTRAHTNSSAHAHFYFGQSNLYQVDVRLAGSVSAFCALALIWSPIVMSHNSVLLFPSFLLKYFTSLYLRFRCWNPQIWWWRSVLDECSPTDIPTMSTPSQSTVTGRRTYLPMTSALICGTWASRTAASVSFTTMIMFSFIPHWFHSF